MDYKGKELDSAPGHCVSVLYNEEGAKNLVAYPGVVVHAERTR